MPIHNGQYYLSNSEMNDWSEMCPLVWKARYIDLLPALWEEPEDINAKDWGTEFECLAIGSGVNGKTVPEAKRIKMQKSDYYARIKAQATDCRSYFKLLGGKIVSRQKYVYTSLKDASGQEIFICGGWDVEYQCADGSKMIIDLKMPGDNANDFGKYQFGKPENREHPQAIHYKLLHRCLYGEDAAFQYWCFDKSPSLKQDRISIEVSEVTELMHIEKCSQVYNEIMFSLEMDDWAYKNSFVNCRDCKVPCKHRRILPDLQEVSV